MALSTISESKALQEVTAMRRLHTEFSHHHCIIQSLHYLQCKLFFTDLKEISGVPACKACVSCVLCTCVAPDCLKLHQYCCQLSAYCPLEFSCLPVPFVYSVLPLIAPSCINVDCQLSACRPLKLCSCLPVCFQSWCNLSCVVSDSD